MQRVKGHGNPGGVRNGTETNEHENVNNWTHRVYPISNYYGTSYPYATYCVGDTSGNAWAGNEPIAYVGNYNGQIAPDATPYGMEGVYNPPAGAPYAAAASYGQATPNNGTFNYFTPIPTDYSAAAAAAAAGAPPSWTATTAIKAYENYYEDPVAAAATIKNIDQRLQNLDLADSNSNKLYSGASIGGIEKKTTTWASIAKQPAKPVPQVSSGGSKKKGPGMPPPPIMPGRHIDLNPWESKVNSMVVKAPVIQAPPLPAHTATAVAKTNVWNGPALVNEPLPPLPIPSCDLIAPPLHQLQQHQHQPPIQFDVSAPPPALPRKMFPVAAGVAPLASVTSSSSSSSTPSPPLPQTVSPSSVMVPPSAVHMPQPSNALTSHHPALANSTATIAPQPLLQPQQQQVHPTPTTAATNSSSYSNSNDSGSSGSNSNGVGGNSNSSYSNCNSSSSATISVMCSAASSSLSSSCSSSSAASSSSSPTTRSPPHQQSQQQQQQELDYQHSVVDKLRDKNNYNPRELELPPVGTRFFVIKSYSEDDVHRSIKYEIWCSTERGNKRLDDAYADQKAIGGGAAVYLFFSVNGSGHFCGVAQMCSPVDYGASSSVWAQDKWKGQFGVRWVYVKDVPNAQLRHIRLENNENKPVTNSRDTQEVPYDKGLNVLKIIHAYSHTTSIFDDFTHYEKRQEEGDSSRRGGGGGGGSGGGGGGGSSQHQAPMQRGGAPPPNRPNPFATRSSTMHKDREIGGGSSFSQMNQNRRGGGRNNGGTGFTNHRNNNSNTMLRS